MIHTKKKWLLVMLCIGISSVCFAQREVKSLIVELNNPEHNQTELVFALSETPKYWTQGGKLIVENKSFRGEVSIDNVKEIRFSKAVPTQSSVTSIDADDISVYPNPAVESISVRGIRDPKSVTLTDLSGRLLEVKMNQGDGEISFNVSGLAPSTYILGIDGKTFKFVKK